MSAKPIARLVAAQAMKSYMYSFVLMISCSLLAGAAVDESDPLCLLSDEATIKLAHDIAAIDDDIPVLQVC